MCFDEFCECIGDLRTNTEIKKKKPKKRTNLEEEVSKIKEKDQEPVVRLSWAEQPAKIAQKKEKPEASPVVRQNPAQRSSGWKLAKKLLGANVRQIGAIDRQAGRSFS